MTTCPDHFKRIHLAACDSTNDYLKRNLARLEADFPLMVSAAVQSAGRGREDREWISSSDLGIYATFGFHLPDKRHLSLLSITSGIAAIDMLHSWTGKVFALKWPNDILAEGKKIAGIICETIIHGDKIICLVGIGININQRPDDFPPELRERAGSLRLLADKKWPVAEGRERLAASMTYWLKKLMQDRGSRIVRRARQLSRSFLGQTISFHHQGQVIVGIFLDIAPDGGLLLGFPGGEKKIFYSGELA
ncbi:MAG: biotin--[acetyl-CoA-carboxylase] ligase [Candidatus Aminicenantes bacterium]|nr:biotin--[acetyl-CoA-carboxylase] ligase [Candidatus Aminicenantes bacterium]